MNSDSIMLDSPAQTPTPKSQPPPAHSTSNDVAMSDTTVATAVDMPTNWLNNSKWTEEYKAAEARLLHRDTFKRLNLRDPMDPPLVNNPPSITPQLEARLRELVASPGAQGAKDREMVA
ncbi:hypothetical protein VMCG_01546 [Cytospora schulzeri]|uniref:Uncharacterized protein n=1 Tax=Cytospora schulzeri TaxID=448051 RepID=A0A423X5R5_9PEZI|nr:hypothetical protein VMCG_01546 [Valsa malicola]